MTSSGQKSKAPCEMSSGYEKAIIDPVLLYFPREAASTKSKPDFGNNHCMIKR